MTDNTIMAELDFRKIRFGKTDAKDERDEYPQLLLDGYLDVDNVVQQAKDSSKYLFLGYKGSGKTALSEHLALSMDENINVDIQSLNRFPYKSFAKIVSGDSEIEVKTRIAWRWLLMIKTLSLQKTDTCAKSTRTDELEKTINILTQAGLFPVLDISSLVSKSSTNTFKASIKAFSAERTTTTENASVSLEMMLDYVEGLTLSFTEGQQQLLIIDGLDDILTTRNDQYIATAALINEVKFLNAKFKQHNIPIKIIVLCRTDIFERLPDPNKNKIRRDNAFLFNWYQEGVENQENCGLVQIANKRAKITYPDIEDMFTEFFPTTYHRKNVRSALLDMTRHTPRDFMQLLISIQNNCQGSKVTLSDIERGFKEYSQNYFVPEIKDEMSGYIAVELQDPILNLLASFRKREFSFVDLDKKFRASAVFKSSSLTLLDICNILYECSAIGHAIPVNKGQDTHFTFKFRNLYSTFNPDNRIVLHSGFWKSLDIH